MPLAEVEARSSDARNHSTTGGQDTYQAEASPDYVWRRFPSARMLPQREELVACALGTAAEASGQELRSIRHSSLRTDPPQIIVIRKCRYARARIEILQRMPVFGGIRADVVVLRSRTQLSVSPLPPTIAESLS